MTFKIEPAGIFIFPVVDNEDSSQQNYFSMSTDKLAEEIRPHIVQKGIRVETANDADGYANIYENMICVPPCNGAVTFAIAMHEIGHIMTVSSEETLGYMFDEKVRMSVEKKAWDWARANSPFWSHPMQELERVCLLSYKLHDDFRSMRINLTKYAKLENERVGIFNSLIEPELEKNKNSA